jgi:hypothetical protein
VRLVMDRSRGILLHIHRNASRFLASHGPQGQWRGEVTRYGLRLFFDNKSAVLIQIGGSGRILIESGGKHWWCRPPKDARWETFPSDYGQTYETLEMAETVAAALKGNREG